MQFVSRGKGAWQWERKRNALVSAILEEDKYITRAEALKKANAMMGESRKPPKGPKKAKPKVSHGDHLHDSKGNRGDDRHGSNGSGNPSGYHSGQAGAAPLPVPKSGGRHYHVVQGCACEVRKAGTERWAAYLTTKELFFTDAVLEDGDLIFTFDGWQLRVAAEIVARVDPPDTVTLTREMLLEAGKTPAGGSAYTKAQVAVFGVEFRKGWLTALVGRTVPREQWKRFVSLGHSAQATLC